ncbi:MAG: hypothetical protein LBQ98_06830 [Nitrososphaerota archaeon]|nr:hypothetical protein [Nitrososphaerota archaeon]
MGNTPIASAQTSVADSLFNIDVPCAYYNANATYNVEINSVFDGSHRVLDIYYRAGSVIAVQPSINYNVLGNDTVARIEIFEYTVYTDNLQLQKTYSYFSYNPEAFGLADNGNGYMVANFASKYWQENIEPKLVGTTKSFGGESVSDPDKPMNVWIAGEMENFGLGTGRSLDKRYRNILAEVEQAQSVYLDVRRVAYMSVYADDTVVIVEDSKLVQHLELTKTNDGFMYGNPADVGREIYFRLHAIPYNGTSLPEHLWPEVWPHLFGE